MDRKHTLIILSLISGCMTPREKREMQSDLFNVQTRLLTLERSLSDTSKDARNTGENASRKLASNHAELERMNHEMQQIRGEIDALKVGVSTGQMPGRENQPNSVASQLGRLSDRLDDMEQTQEELLEALKKAGLSKSSGKKASGSSKKISSIGDLQSAFDDKKYKQVIEDGPRLGSTGSSADKEKARFLTAEAFFKLGKMREAALKYSEFVESHPSPKFLPTVKMRLGDCFRHLGDKATAQIYYEELIKEFPDSDEAGKAKERLSQDEKKSQSDDTDKG